MIRARLVLAVSDYGSATLLLLLLLHQPSLSASIQPVVVAFEPPRNDWSDFQLKNKIKQKRFEFGPEPTDQ